MSEDYWIWQGDDEDHLESLICPVLIEAEDLRQLLADEMAKVLKEVGEGLEAQNWGVNHGAYVIPRLVMKGFIQSLKKGVLP